MPSLNLEDVLEGAVDAAYAMEEAEDLFGLDSEEWEIASEQFDCWRAKYFYLRLKGDGKKS